MSSHGVYSAAVHNYDTVGVLHRGGSLSNDYLGGVGHKLFKALSYQSVGFGIHGAGGVVENKYLGLFKKGSRYAQTLLLSPGNVGAALLDIGVVLVGEALDKFVRLSDFAGLDQLPSVAFFLPQRRFSLIVPLKSTFFCKTTAT